MAIIDSISGKRYELEKGNPFLVEGIERKGRTVVTVRRTYYAANEDEARAEAEKENITVHSVTDLLKVSK